MVAGFSQSKKALLELYPTVPMLSSHPTQKWL
jgi:hypothetical protein